MKLCPIYKGACLFATPNPRNTSLRNKAQRMYQLAFVEGIIRPGREGVGPDNFNTASHSPVTPHQP